MSFTVVTEPIGEAFFSESSGASACSGVSTTPGATALNRMRSFAYSKAKLLTPAFRPPLVIMETEAGSPAIGLSTSAAVSSSGKALTAVGTTTPFGLDRDRRCDGGCKEYYGPECNSSFHVTPVVRATNAARFPAESSQAEFLRRRLTSLALREFSKP